MWLSQIPERQQVLVYDDLQLVYGDQQQHEGHNPDAEQVLEQVLVDNDHEGHNVKVQEESDIGQAIKSGETN